MNHAHKQAFHTVWQQLPTLQQITMRVKDVQVKLGTIEVTILKFVYELLRALYLAVVLVFTDTGTIFCSRKT